MMTKAQMKAQMDMQETRIAELERMIEEMRAGKKGGKKSAPSEELVEFRKKDGTVRMVTQETADRWTKWRDGGQEHLDKWAKERSSYKPSKELINAIKRDRAAITRKVAVAQYGFVGTKEDLKALKEQVCK